MLFVPVAVVVVGGLKLHRPCTSMTLFLVLVLGDDDSVQANTGATNTGERVSVQVGSAIRLFYLRLSIGWRASPL
jgi:hypothetical protein